MLLSHADNYVNLIAMVIESNRLEWSFNFFFSKTNVINATQ